MTLLHAVFADSLGDVRALAIRPHDCGGPPAPGHVRVRMRYVGIGFADVLIVEGRYQAAPGLPFIPGTEGAGIVEALGAGVNGFVVGDEVVCRGWCGMLAQAINLPAQDVRLRPRPLDLAQAAVFQTSYETAWHALADRGGLRSGEALLVLGAAGGTGLAAVQIGRHMGARVIACASTPEKRALAMSAGADAVVGAFSAEWREAVRQANGGRGIDVTFDPVGGEMTAAAFRNMGWGGRHLIIGFPAGIASIATNLPLLKGASIVGVDVRQFAMHDPQKAEANRDRLFAIAAQGNLRPRVARRFAMEDVAQAMLMVASGQSAGRVVVTL